MVLRLGSTTPKNEQEAVIKQEPGAGSPSVARSPTTSEHEEGPAASWSAEGTFTTGHSTSDEKEGYEEQFAVPDVASPAEATKGSDPCQSPTGLKPAKVEDRQSPTAKVVAKTKTKKKKKKLRAPGSADESPPKPGVKDAGHQYTAREMEHALSRTELFRLLERDPIPRFVKPNLMTKLAGPIQAPEVASLTSVRRAAQTLFNILRDPGFVLGAFAMGKVYDWDLAFWTNAIQAILDTLTNPGGVVKCESSPTQAKPAPSPTMTPSPRYQSSKDSDISVEYPKRMSMERPPSVMQLTSAPTHVETPAAPMGAIPRALEAAIVRLMQSTLTKSTAAEPSATCHASAQVAALAPTPPEHPAPATISQPEPVDDVDMKSVSSQSTTRSKHHRDEEDPGDVFALADGAPGTVTAISTATAGTGQARVRLSASSELKEFHGGDLSDEKARAWLNRLKMAARRDTMTCEEVCSLFSDLINGPARQWYRQLTKKVRKTWPDLMEQFRIQYCDKGVSMASRYHHALNRADGTPLKYLYRVNVAGLGTHIPYTDGTTEDKREHVELFINILEYQVEELTSQLTLIEVPDSIDLEEKLHARQRGLAHQKKTLLGSSKFRQKVAAPTLQPARAVHAIHLASDGYESERESRDGEGSLCKQGRDDEDRARLFVAGQVPTGESARRDFETAAGTS